MKKLILTLCAALIASSLLVACDGGDASSDIDTTTSATNDQDATNDTTTEAQMQKTLIISDKYTVVYSADAFKDRGLALDIASTLKLQAKLAVACKSDADAAESEYEILVGNTNRPESATALEMMGDKHLIITVIDNKIVVYAKDVDLYDALYTRLIHALIKDGTAEIDKDFLLISNKEDYFTAEQTLSDNTRLSFDVSLFHVKSAAVIKLGDSCRLEITKDALTLYSQNKKLASSVISLKTKQSYTVMCDVIGGYLRVYLCDTPEDVEPWPKFEVKLQLPDACSVALGETSGYGADYVNITASAAQDDTEGKQTYRNNLIRDGADPDILYYDGYYYLYVTGTGYPVYRSSNLATWELVGKSLPEVSWNIDKQYMWAPDVEYIDGKFYMSVSMGEAGFGIAVSDSPTGPFVCAGDMPFLTKTIDGHIFADDDGRIYLYYTSWCNGRKYGIWGVEMQSDCLTPKWETEKLIFTPTEPWENTMDMGGVVEAPFMLKKDGTYYLIYSGSHYMADYAVGYATSKNPLEGFKKSADNPILVGTADTCGTGHCSIVTSPSGKMAMVYHVHNTTDSVHPRYTAIDAVRFVPTENGYRLEVYGPTTSKRPLELLK